MRAPGELHLRVVRSEVAHGVLRGIDAAAAAAAPGVHSVWTAADLADLPPIGFRMTRVAGLEHYRQPVLARDRVRYVGEPVAFVLAEDPYRAEDAAELVQADIGPLPPLLDAAAPTGEWPPGRPTEPAVVVKETGDLAAAFAAAHVVELGLATARHSAVPLDLRGALAFWNYERDRLEVHGAAKVPHFNRLALAGMLGLDPLRIHLFEGHVGGGFGVRGELYPEDVMVACAALRLRRPVKWVEDRRAHLLAANQSRGQTHRIRAAVDPEGVVLGVDDVFWHDQGAYVRTHAATVPDLTAAMLPGPYRFPAFRSRGHIRLTNKTPCGTYRAPGRFEGSFVRERLMDAVAARLGLDPVEMRRRNLIPPESIPWARGFDALGTPVVLDSADFPKLLAKLEAWADLPAMRAKAAARRAAGEMVGVGLAWFVEKSGLGPFDDVVVTLDADGGAEVVTGAASLGQGVETAMAQVLHTTIPVPPERIAVVHGQTDRIARGMGAFASRVTVMTGSAVSIAAAELREALLAAAATLLQTPVEALALRAAGDGPVIGRTDGAGPSLPVREAVLAAAPGGRLSAAATFETAQMTYPYGIHLAQVRIDRETCAVSVEGFLVAFDIGRAMNPTLVEGQIAGGAAQGLGGALLEEFRYDAEGQPQSVTLADYLLPTLAEVAAIEILVTEDAPSPLNPLGVKGAGEGGIAAAGAAIATAVDDAAGRPGTVAELPITPQRLHAALRAAGC
jgi:carbon-monoxide dehydrogenase large subunit